MKKESPIKSGVKKKVKSRRERRAAFLKEYLELCTRHGLLIDMVDYDYLTVSELEPEYRALAVSTDNNHLSFISLDTLPTMDLYRVDMLILPPEDQLEEAITQREKRFRKTMAEHLAKIKQLGKEGK